MKKIIKIILLLFLCFPLFIGAKEKYVIDKADVLTDDAESYIEKYSDFLYKVEKIDFYVVSIDYIDFDFTIEDYTNYIFDEYKLSSKGLLILVSKDDRKIRIQAGDDLSNILDNDKIDEFMKEYFIPFLEHSEWNDGIINGYSAMYKYICEEYNIDASSMEVADDVDFLIKYKTPLMLLIILICSFFATIYKKIINKKGNMPLMIILILLNIVVISFAYVIEPVYFLFALAFQGVFIYTKFGIREKKLNSDNNRSKRVRKIKKKSKK